jgi:hypothetical protein
MQIDIPKYDISMMRRALSLHIDGHGPTPEEKAIFREILKRLNQRRPTRATPVAMGKAVMRR